VLAVALAFSAAACWGVADFGGGWFSRRSPVAGVLLLIQSGGLLAALIFVLAARDSLDAGGALLGALAGLAGVTGLGLLYSALAAGTMSVVAPIASTGAVVPVVVGLLGGDSLTAVVATGIAVAFAGVILASLETSEGTSRTTAGAGRAVAAAAGFGIFFVVFKHASEHSESWALLFSRLPAIPVVGAIALAQKAPLPTGRARWQILALAQLDAVATGLYSMALTRGELSVVAVIGSLYPIGTVLLARVLLGERMRRVQLVGVLAAFLGVALVTAGTA